MLLVVGEQDRTRAARGAVGREQSVDTADHVLAARVGVARRAGRADGRAVAAAAADRRIDRDVVADGRDRARRANLEAVAAADLVAAGVRANAGVVGHVARLLELADEVGDLEHGARHRRRVVRIDVQVPVPTLVAEQPRAAEEVENEIALRFGAVAGHGEVEAGARGRQHRCVAIDLDLEGADVAARAADATLGDRHRHGARRMASAGSVSSSVTLMRPAKTRPRAPCCRRRRRDRRRRLQREQRGGLGVVGRLGEQRGHLRQRSALVLAPAGRLADVGEAQLGLAALLGGDLAEQRRLLRARRARRRPRAPPFRTTLRAAELGVNRNGRAVAAGPELGAIDLHGPLTIADQQPLAGRGGHLSLRSRR